MDVTIRETKLAITQHEHGNLPISTEIGKGFRPYELFISAIAGCAGMTFAKIAEKQRLDIESIHLVTGVKRIQEEANRISEI
ncbi:OsmC family protein [Domibacillus sp. 8LH]|uniref:OsmC family protein n=1 Tax=Domibacillus sp. 8LH TaxID=3073900 RepID=UPI003179CB8A